MFFRQKKRDGIAITLAHFAPIQPLQYCRAFLNQGFWQHKMFAVVMVESPGYITCHFNVLDLVAPYRHLVGVKHQNIGGHQNGIGIQPHSDAKIRVITVSNIRIDRCFVGMRAIHQPFGCHAGQYPAELWNFWHIGLAIKNRIIHVQPQSQPGGSNFAGGLMNQIRLLALNQRMKIGQKIK